MHIYTINAEDDFKSLEVCHKVVRGGESNVQQEWLVNFTFLVEVLHYFKNSGMYEEDEMQVLPKLSVFLFT